MAAGATASRKRLGFLHRVLMSPFPISRPISAILTKRTWRAISLSC
jgi:hypothetical protein